MCRLILYFLLVFLLKDTKIQTDSNWSGILGVWTRADATWRRVCCTCSHSSCAHLVSGQPLDSILCDLLYNIKNLEATFVVVWRYITKIELNISTRICKSGSPAQVNTLMSADVCRQVSSLPGYYEASRRAPPPGLLLSSTAPPERRRGEHEARNKSWWSRVASVTCEQVWTGVNRLQEHFQQL